MGITAILPDQVLAAGANDGDVLTVQADGSAAFETPAAGGGIGGSAGGTDNAILRADGTGGSTVQGSLAIIDDDGSIGVPLGAWISLRTQSGTAGSSSGLRQSGVYVVARAYSTDMLGLSHYGYTTTRYDCGYAFSASTSVTSHPSNGIYRTDDDNIRASTWADRTTPSCGLQASHFQAYNTYTSPTSYERLDIDWSADVCTIQTSAGSAGGIKRGVKFGGASTDELGFFGATPVDQPATVADPSGGSTVDTEARAAIAAVIDRLQELGLIA